MQGLEHATLGVLVMMVLLVAPVLYYIRRAGQGMLTYVRRIPGIDAVDEAVGRTAELGRPMVVSTGLTGVGPVLYACLGVVHYIARKAARLKTTLFLPQNDSAVLPIVADTAKDAYRMEGRSAQFEERNVMFLSDEQFAYTAGYMGLVHRENVGTAFLFGSFAAESLILAEAGRQVGAMQVAGCVSPEQVPFFVCSCDYTLIGEELFAASSYLTKEPVQLGSLYGQDRAKLLIFCLIIIGVIIATINSFGVAIPNVDSLIAAEVW